MYFYRPLSASLNDKLDLQDCLEVGRVAQVRRIKERIDTNHSEPHVDLS